MAEVTKQWRSAMRRVRTGRREGFVSTGLTGLEAHAKRIQLIAINYVC